MNLDFSEDTVIVTGGSAGIGRAIAIGFADCGADVVIGDISSTPKSGGETTPTVEHIRNNDGTATFIETDVSNEEDIAELIVGAEEFGGVDVMVNNAAMYSRSSILEITSEELDTIQSTNESSVIFGTQYAARSMIDRGQPGCIVNISSVSAEMAQSNQIGCAASKGAVKMITRATAYELARRNIRVNAVAPGQIATTFVKEQPDDIRRAVETDSYTKSIPLERAGEPSDVSNAVRFLASEAASYITGETIVVDGGWTLQ
jgi:NAD(P)-dependent dehydrogenase (short-subunit alcohol dehydrogenase family)